MSLRDEITAQYLPLTRDLCARHWRPLRAIAATPDDLLSETWLAVWRHPIRFYWLSLSPLDATLYLTCIVRHQLANLQRLYLGRTNRKRQGEQVYAKPEGQPNPDLLHVDALDAIAAIRAILPPHEFAALEILAFHQGEIYKMPLSCTDTTIYNRAARARRRIRAALPQLCQGERPRAQTTKGNKL